MTSEEKMLYINDYTDDELFGEQDNLLVSTIKLPFKYDLNFVQHAKENSWLSRRDNERSWPWKTDVFEFIREVYRPWLGKGLVQADIRSVDKPLYAEFHKRLSSMPPTEREKILESLNLPTASDARMAEIEDPAERAQREVVRAWWRAQKAAAPRP